MEILWEEWLASNENWKVSNYAIRLSRSRLHETIGARRWMTFKQLCDKYQDQEIAESIREAKLNDPDKSHVKPHPDTPDNPATQQHTAQPLQVHNSSGSTGRSIRHPQINLVGDLLTASFFDVCMLSISAHADS